MYLEEKTDNNTVHIPDVACTARGEDKTHEHMTQDGEGRKCSTQGGFTQ
jgi:hypothetical protein